jgi:hypothetical protein
VIASIVNTGTLTLPTTDTLVGRATTDTLTNKTLTLPQINDTSADHQYVFAVSELVADRTVTLPLLTGNDTFVFADFIQTLANKTLTTPTIASFVNATHNDQAAAGGGTLDHGLALTGLGDDDHTQYLLATGTRTGAASSSQTFTTGVIDSSLTATRLMASDGSKKLASVADLSSWIGGTANRVTVTSDGDGTVTLSGPQDIHSGASPTFVRATLSQATGTSPLTVSSTTVVSNLNADKADGYDFDQDVRVAGTPQFARIGAGVAAHATYKIYALGDSLLDGHVEMDSADVNGALNVYGGDLRVFPVGDFSTPLLYVDESARSIGVNRDPDIQFSLDVAGALRAEWLIGPHAIQLSDAEAIMHFDGPGPYETNFVGTSQTHKGKLATLTGGVIYRLGKFQKAVQVAEATTNLVTNPSLETNTTSWTEYFSGTAAGTRTRVTTESFVGSYSLMVVKSAGATADRYGSQVDLSVTSGTTYTVSVWVKTTAYSGGTGEVKLLIDGAVPSTVTSVTGILSDWTRLVVTATASSTGTMRILAGYFNNADTGTVYIDALQVEALAYATPYCDGSLTNPTSWSGTAHASTSSRTAGMITYPKIPVLATAGSVMAWVWLEAGNAAGLRMIWDGAGTGNNGLVLYVDASGYTTFLFGDGGATRSSVYASALATQTWYHIAATWDSTGSVLYVDGVEKATAAYTPSITLTDTMVIGRQRSSATRWLDGKVDEFVLLSRVADADEIRAIYESNAPVFAESSVAFFKSYGPTPVEINDEGMWVEGPTVGAIFGIYGAASTKSWGGVTLAEGDILIGRSPAYALWDDSQVKLKIGNVSDEHIAFDGTKVEFLNGASSMGSLTGTTWVLGQAAGDRLELTATDIRFKTGAGTTEAIFDASSITLGQTGSNHILITPTALSIKYSGTSKISLDSSGNASFTGSVTAATGAIGNWTIGTNTISATNLALTSGAANTAHILAGTGATAGGVNSAAAAGDIVFWAGSTHANRATANFRVEADGSLYASDANITGAIDANSGTLGSLTVDGTLSLGTGGVIKSGATAYNTGTGFWFDYNAGTPRFFIGNAAGNKLTWDGSSLSITGSITLTNTIANTSVTGLGTLSTKNAVDLATGEVTNKSLANVDSTANTKLSGIAAGATVGAAWGTNLTGRPTELTDGRIATALNASGTVLTKVVPTSLAAPSGSGLYLGSDYMGFYNGTAWKTYMSNTGAFYLSGVSGNALAWDGTTLTIVGNGAGITAINGANITTGSITATQIAADTITGAKIAAGTITASEIAADTITASLIAAGTITATEIATGTITATQIAAGTITAAKIAAGTITSTQLAADSVTATQINVSDLASVSATMGTLTVNSTLTVSGAGAIGMGATGVATGTGLWMNTAGITGLNASVVQALFSAATGKITAGAGVVTLDVNGISIEAHTLDALSQPKVVSWLTSGTIVGDIGVRNYTGYNKLLIEVNAVAAKASAINILSQSPTGYPSSIILETKVNGVTGGYVEVDSSSVTVAIGSAYMQMFSSGTEFGGNVNFSAGTVTIDNTGLHVNSTNASFDLVITPGSSLTADRILTLITGDAARTITLDGNPTLNDWFNQNVKTTGTPSFAALTVNGNITVTGTVDGLDIAAHGSSTAAHGATGAVVGTTNTQTLTGKTISIDSNTLSGMVASSFVLSNASGYIDGAAAQKVIPSGAVVGTTDTQTLSGKTLTSPTINSGALSGTFSGGHTISGVATFSGNFGGAWTTASYASGWSDGGGNSVRSYRKIGDLVFLRGRPWSAAAFSANATIFTLPSGYRPPATFGAICFAGNYGKARIQISTAGVVSVASDSDNWGLAGNWLELDGIVFSTI